MAAKSRALTTSSAAPRVSARNMFMIDGSNVIGMTNDTLSCGVTLKLRSTEAICALISQCSTRTPFGFPVEPDV